MNEAQQRAAVLAEAMTWLGTPFHNNACVKGAGVDCAQFCARVYANAGVIAQFDVEAYSPQWFLHKDEERFIAQVKKSAREIPIEKVKPADIVVYKIGRTYAHGAIVIDWPEKIVHAHLQSGRVLVSRAFDGDLWGRDVRAFTLWSA